MNKKFDFRALGLFEMDVPEWEKYYAHALRYGTEQILLEQGLQPEFTIKVGLLLSDKAPNEDYLVVFLDCRDEQNKTVVEEAVVESSCWIDESVKDYFEHACLPPNQGLLMIAKGVFAVEFPLVASETKPAKPRLSLVP